MSITDLFVGLDDASRYWPYQREGIDAHEVLDEIVLYDPQREAAFSLNHSSRSIWELCDGERTIVEISQEIGRRLGSLDGEASAQLLADIIDAIHQLYTYQLLVLANQPRSPST